MSAGIKSAVTEHFDAWRVDVTTAAAAIAAADTNNAFGIRIVADPANAVAVYIGPSDVTPGTTAATDGYYLAPGRELTIPKGDPRQVFAVCPSSTAKIHVMVC